MLLPGLVMSLLFSVGRKELSHERGQQMTLRQT
ncbi:Uncharacterised protein [Escherichia coli]|nr:Uncharacterised protein [Escherichia coli]VWN08163.1 Uncharacterised protein [Escherichia coli]